MIELIFLKVPSNSLTSWTELSYLCFDIPDFHVVMEMKNSDKIWKCLTGMSVPSFFSTEITNVFPSEL